MILEPFTKAIGVTRAAAIALAIGFGYGGTGTGFGQSGNSLFFGEDVNVNPTTTTTSGGGSGRQGMISSGDVEIKPNDPAELKASKKLYLAKISEFRQPLIGLLQKYNEQLAKMRDGFQKAGDLDNLLAAKKEIEAIKKNGRPDELASKSAQVNATRGIYDTAKAKIELEIGEKIGQLNAAYVGSLDGLKTTLMKEDRLDDAIIVMDLIKAIESAPKVAAVEMASPVAANKKVLNPRGSLSVSVQVDGMSTMFISGNKIWFDHREGRAKPPGLHKGSFATRLNGEDWIPDWDGKVTRRFDAEIGLPTSGEVEISYLHKKGRGHAKVLEQPSEGNEYTAKIGLYDQDENGRGFGAAQFINFELSW